MGCIGYIHGLGAALYTFYLFFAGPVPEAPLAKARSTNIFSVSFRQDGRVMFAYMCILSIQEHWPLLLVRMCCILGACSSKILHGRSLNDSSDYIQYFQVSYDLEVRLQMVFFDSVATYVLILLKAHMTVKGKASMYGPLYREGMSCGRGH